MKIDGTAAIGIQGSPAPELAKIRDGAAQFEALLVAQMLKAARESGDGGWTGTDTSQTDTTMMEMAEGCFAQMMTSGRGMGLRDLIERQLAKQPLQTRGAAGSKKA